MSFGGLIWILQWLLDKLILPIGIYFFAKLYFKLSKLNQYRFFGLLKTKKIAVVPSNLYKRELNTNTQNGSDESQKFILSGTEFNAIVHIENMFKSSSLEGLLGFLTNVVSFQSKVKVDIKKESIETANLPDLKDYDTRFDLGTGFLNSRRNRFLREPHMAEFCNESMQVLGMGKAFEHKVVFPEDGIVKSVTSDGEILCIIEKYNNNNQVVFSIAGFDGYSTSKGAEFLVNSWRMIQKLYGNDPFAICLRITPKESVIAYGRGVNGFIGNLNI